MSSIPSTLERKTILLVNEEEAWRDMVSNRLSAAGYDVCTAADASQAMAWAEEPTLGLIIVDDSLGGESGLILTKFLHRNHPEVPTILCTRCDYDEMSTLDIMEQGVNQCLAKGSMEELLASVACYFS